MKPILDATAANRVMWKKGGRGHNPDIVFLDMEYRLKIPPTIFADNTMLPFRDDCFSLVISDHPYHFKRTNKESWTFFNPGLEKTSMVHGYGKPKVWGHYGMFDSKRQLVMTLWKSAREYARVAPRLCFKWGEGTLNIWKARALIIHEGWAQVYEKIWRSRGWRNISKTYWTTFIRSNNDPTGGIP